MIAKANESAEPSSDWKGLLQSDQLYKTSVFPGEPETLKELRKVTATHPKAYLATLPDAGQFIALLLNLINAKRTIEWGVFTGYSLLLTALSIPDGGKITAVDINRETYEMGLPIIRKAGVEHKIEFIESEALSVLDELLKDLAIEGSFDYAYVDAEKVNNCSHHERLLKLLKVGEVIVHDNTLWFGSVAMPDESTPEILKKSRHISVEFNEVLVADPRIQISLAPLDDGITICRHLY